MTRRAQGRDSPSVSLGGSQSLKVNKSLRRWAETEKNQRVEQEKNLRTQQIVRGSGKTEVGSAAGLRRAAVQLVSCPPGRLAAPVFAGRSIFSRLPLAGPRLRGDVRCPP